MGERGESSSSHQFFRNEGFHAPATPPLLSRPDPNKNWVKIPFEDPSVKKSVSCTAGKVGSTSQSYEMCDKFSMGEVGSISCSKTSSTVEKLPTTNGSNIVIPNEDRNVFAHEESEEWLTDLKETQKQKQRKRKHRPKVVAELRTPKADDFSTGKRKYVRRKLVEKSTTTTTTTAEASAVDETGDEKSNKKICKRKIDFDEGERHVDVVESYQKPNSPVRSELPHGRLKGKCKINFLQVTHDKGPNLNEPGCSSSEFHRVDSLESFLSIYTDYKTDSMQLSEINKVESKPLYGIESLIDQFERLHINGDGVMEYNSGKDEKNAVVVYQQEGSIVAYEGLKKKRQRGKVELDDETNRVWMLLLEDANSKGIDGEDEDKKKWWEEERKVFRDRADSFIRRMRLIQGDRQFSQWKGSVLDSVVGVYLTQNVSDHLSSSAFMSLAARYPLKRPARVYERRSKCKKCAIEGSGVSTSQTTIYMVNPIRVQKVVDFHSNANGSSEINNGYSEVRKEKSKVKVDWDKVKLEAEEVKEKRERKTRTTDSMDYEAIRKADVNDVADAIKQRGMNNRLAKRIKDMLDRLVREHGSMDLEWLRDVPPDKVKEYLLSFRGLGLKSVECIRLLTLHHIAFPVDTNVGRIAVRLGWVPLQPLPESLQLHLLELARLALPAPEESNTSSTESTTGQNSIGMIYLPSSSEQPNHLSVIEEPATPGFLIEIPETTEPLVEMPESPEPEQIQHQQQEDEVMDMEDFGGEIPVIRLNIEEFTQNLQTYMERHMELGEGEMSKALVMLTPQAASIPAPKLKNVSQLRTEHQVYELPDSHPLLERMDTREPDDPSPYLLAIWTPGETADSSKPPDHQCCSQQSGTLCKEETCFLCNSTREANSQTVRGTLLIPCRTAMRGSFPLNGTYFQVNEVFADHASSLNPIDVPRAWLWNLPRRTVYFGTSIPTIFKGLKTEETQCCFWKGFVCVRGFDQKTRAPRSLMARLHFPASRLKN